ncbi:MAG: hypothetical protein AAGH46_02705, partial [Bacteroidota bacterium]
KELHLVNNPSGKYDETNELYFRRWAVVATLKVGDTLMDKEDQFKVRVIDTKENGKYLIFSSASPTRSDPDRFKSICFGFFVERQLTNKIAFAKNPSISSFNVEKEVYDKSQIFDSQNKIEQPIAIEKQSKNEEIETIVKELRQTFKS